MTEESSANPQSLKTRIFVLTGFIIVAFLLLVVYLFFLQIVNSPEYKRRAKAVASRVMRIPARRGEIFDRNYDIPLVSNTDSFTVNVVPGEIPRDRMQEIFEKLAKLLDIDIEEIREKVKEKHYRLFRPFAIKTEVSKEVVYYLAEHIQLYPGVMWQSEPKRSYAPLGSLSHILGYVDTMTTEEIQVLYNKGYSFDAVIGKMGIEKYYDPVLRGKDGKRFKIVDAKGKQTAAQADKAIPPEPGKNLVLTIDRHIQRLCEEALGKRKGSVVVLKPASGEILAMVSYPWYESSIFAGGISAAKYREFALDPESPFLNRALHSVYPPASVFKIALTAAVIEEAVFPVDERIVCTGSMYYGDRVWNCWKLAGHGPLNLSGALAKSCDVYFWNMGLKLGVEKILLYARDFGLGKATGIDLPGEESGFLATPEWKEQKYHMKWLGGDTMNTAIGQGWTLVTPIQIANMVAMVANEGIVYKPYVLREIRDPETGDIVERTEREILLQSSIDRKTLRAVQRAMRLVITEGTARYVLTTQAVEAAGKTGTGETGVAESYHSWFTAYAPYRTSDPDERVVVVVMVEATRDTDGYEWWSPKAGNVILQGIFARQDYSDAVATLNLWYLNRDREAR